MAKEVIAILRDTRTGQTVNDTHDEYGDDYENASIINHWTEGNYGCDCNRAMFMGLDAPCSRGLISLDSLLVNGVEVYSEVDNA